MQGSKGPVDTMVAPPRRSGIFTISLDFELHWGVRDKRSVGQYGEALLGARRAIPRMLELFSRYGVHATWATVGFLFCESKRQLLDYAPSILPRYDQARLSPYAALDEVGENEREDPYHFAPSLIRRILDYPGQEIATHTYSHYYCLEAGQTREAFKADLRAAIEVAKATGIETRSIVFPRNQYNEHYLEALTELGIIAYRGNPRTWMYRASDDRGTNRLSKRIGRFADTYFPLTRPAVRREQLGRTAPVDIRATRFLRPAGAGGSWRPAMHLWRIKREMSAAARRGCLFHLWWHPHNFGTETERKLAYLEDILRHFVHVREHYAMESMSMAEAAQAALGQPMLAPGGADRTRAAARAQADGPAKANGTFTAP